VTKSEGILKGKGMEKLMIIREEGIKRRRWQQ
jgi:hypothetical protein